MIRWLVPVASVAIALVCLAPPAAAQGNVDRGRTLFSQKCLVCHSLAGKGNKAGPIEGVGSKLKADEIREWIMNPDVMYAKAKATRTPKMMKQQLTTEQVDDLVAFLQTLK
jgi:mono/diheme cytochrome c family protein